MSGGAVNLNLNLNLRRDVEPLELLKQLAFSPLIYIRLAGILFSIIVFGCVADQVQNAFINSAGITGCGYNFNANACNFAIAVGVISFLICLTFLTKDVLYVIIDYTEAMVVKKVIVIVDAITNGFWGFMWFVCFCFTANERRLTGSIPVVSVRNCANSGVAFSFFNIFVFGAIVGLNVFYFFRLMRGADSQGGGGGYASFPEPTGGGNEGGPSSSDYTPPEY